MSCHEPLLAALKKHGLRRTPQRTVILEQLCHSHGHRTADHIFRLARRHMPDLNIATVYRTLETLRASGVVSAVVTPDGLTEFELSRPEVRHHHLRCRRCGSEWLLPSPPVEKLKTWIKAQQSFQPDLDHLVITGLCDACARQTSPAALRGG